VLAERPDHFVNATGDGIRPGVLMLVNDCDCEVLGGHDYIVEEGDVVAFISTLHGG
jgi:ubiquitin related modifier 1